MEKPKCTNDDPSIKATQNTEEEIQETQDSMSELPDLNTPQTSKSSTPKTVTSSTAKAETNRSSTIKPLPRRQPRNNVSTAPTNGNFYQTRRSTGLSGNNNGKRKQ